MMKHALLLQHPTKPGARSDVEKVWQKHMQPAVPENPEHEIYVYSFGDDPDRICAFQVYASVEVANEILKSQAYRDYGHEVTPMLEGPPTSEVLKPKWIKPGY